MSGAIAAGINWCAVAFWNVGAVSSFKGIVVTTCAVVVVAPAIRIVTPISITGANDADVGDTVFGGAVATVVVTGGIISAGSEEKGYRGTSEKGQAVVHLSGLTRWR
jgi:hypothetical protein